MSKKRDAVKRRLAFGLAAGLVLVAVSVAAAFAWNARDSSASGSTPTGTIAVSAQGTHLNTFSDLHLIEADGSNRRVLARCPVGSGDALWLKYPFGCEVRGYAWSPDGSKLAFLRGRRGGSTLGTDLSLYVVDADGNRELRLPGCGGPRWPSCGDRFGSNPTWAPDGSRLVVQRRGRLLMVNVDHGRYRHLTHGCRPRVCFDMHPAWSPEGSRIAFVRTEGPRARSFFSIKPDGSGLKRLTGFRGWWTAGPAWSPDGRRIAFDFVNETASGIRLIGADGTEEKSLASGPTVRGSHSPSWSPDGTRLVYLSTVTLRPIPPGQVAGPGFALEVRVINPDGTGGKRLYRSRDGLSHYVGPVWSPDGRWISFGVNVYDEQGDGFDREGSGTFLLKADGTAVRKLTDVAWVEVAWRPIP